jgi:hypothetical protein
MLSLTRLHRQFRLASPEGSLMCSFLPTMHFASYATAASHCRALRNLLVKRSTDSSRTLCSSTPYGFGMRIVLIISEPDMKKSVTNG